MKVMVIRHDLVTLTSENDSDAALLRSWQFSDVRIASTSSAAGVAKSIEMNLQFQPKIGRD